MPTSGVGLEISNQETSMRIPLFGRKNMDSATDPVCGMDVDVTNPRGVTAEYKEKNTIFVHLDVGRPLL